MNIQPDESGSRAWDPVVQRGFLTEPQSVLQQLNDPAPFKLTIVVPVYNEEQTVRQVLDSLIAQPIPGDFEIIVVDDGSTDRTKDILQASWHNRHVCVRHETNRGKGAAVRTPNRVRRLSATGALFPSFINVLGNRLMTAAANALYATAISDLHTCLKLLPIPMLRLMQLEEEGFGLDTEISAELLRRGFRPYEIPVSYVGRSRAEGKKIRLSDAFRCLQVLLKVRLRGRTQYGARDKTIAPRVWLAAWPEAANAVNAVDL